MPGRAASTATAPPSAAKHETDLPDPVSPYAAAKAAGELYCQAFTATYGLPTVTVRYFNVFGPRQDPNSEYAAVIPKFVMKMLAGERPTIFGDGKQSRDFTYVANVVAGNLLAAKVPDAAGKTFNVACGEQDEPAGPGRRDQPRAGHEDRADLRAAAGGRRPRQPGRHLAGQGKCSATSRWSISTKVCAGRSITIAPWRKREDGPAIDSRRRIGYPNQEFQGAP